MGKRKEIEEPSISGNDPGLQKKHKKHKHKKHKKRREAGESGGIIVDVSKMIASAAAERSLVAQSSTPPRPVEMKILTQSPQTGISPPKSGSKKKKGKGRESGTSSDEERWLDAIQSGKLEEVDDELKKMKTKDPKLMTARQRAMLERKGDAVPDPGTEQPTLLALPTGYREKVMTPEMIKKAALKSQKRKQLLDEKREKDKKRTMERLLRKQDNKGKQGKKTTRRAGATITYSNTPDKITISLPAGIDFPLSPAVEKKPPAPVHCGVRGCPNLKKYSCSKTGVPLCSFECYKVNMSKRKDLPLQAVSVM